MTPWPRSRTRSRSRRQSLSPPPGLQARVRRALSAQAAGAGGAAASGTLTPPAAFGAVRGLPWGNEPISLHAVGAAAVLQARGDFLLAELHSTQLQLRELVPGARLVPAAWRDPPQSSPASSLAIRLRRDSPELASELRSLLARVVASEDSEEDGEYRQGRTATASAQPSVPHVLPPRTLRPIELLPCMHEMPQTIEREPIVPQLHIEAMETVQPQLWSETIEPQLQPIEPIEPQPIEPQPIKPNVLFDPRRAWLTSERGPS